MLFHYFCFQNFSPFPSPFGRIFDDICQVSLAITVVFQIRLLSTWGDPYYIGLNGIEFYDECGVKIPLDENSILFTQIQIGRYLF